MKCCEGVERHRVDCLLVKATVDPLEKALLVYPDFTIPDPLTECTRCGEHAALFKDEDGFYCGPCSTRVSVFALPVHHDDLRQAAADAELERAT